MEVGGGVHPEDVPEPAGPGLVDFVHQVVGRCPVLVGDLPARDLGEVARVEHLDRVGRGVREGVGFGPVADDGGNTARAETRE